MANRDLRNPSVLLDPSIFGAPRTVKDVVSQSLAPLGASAGRNAGDVGQQLAEQLQQLQSVSQAQMEAVQANTQAVTQSTTQLGQSGQSAAGKAASAIQSTFGPGLGFSPLITGLLSLFGGGGGASQATIPEAFALPPSVDINAGLRETAATQAPQITVQVQAIDSQSFLDHSNDIAMAVRQAMLQSTVLNDVIREV